jgi:hypothetical protein
MMPLVWQPIIPVTSSKKFYINKGPIFQDYREIFASLLKKDLYKYVLLSLQEMFNMNFSALIEKNDLKVLRVLSISKTTVLNTKLFRSNYVQPLP